MNCTIHTARKLEPKKTQYGIRYSCPVGGCTVVLWNGSTSTPADFATRQARIMAHDMFDKLWKSGMFTRGEVYKKLSEYMNLPQEKTHIGHFDKEQCDKVIRLCDELLTSK